MRRPESFARTLPIVLLAACAASCGLLGGQPVEIDRPVRATETGTRVEDRLVGLGPAATDGDLVAIHYLAWLEDGTQIDSTRDRGRPVEFTVGEAPLPGWNEGVRGMRAGGIRRVELPPERAYGAEGVAGLVPPHATLVFEIELLRIGPAAPVEIE